MSSVFQETLATHFPDHRFTTELKNIRLKKGYWWFVEPICGEENFLRSLPEYCAVIGIFLDGSLHHTIIYHYLEDVEFHATKNDGAMVNQSRLRVSGNTSLNRAVIALAQQNSGSHFAQQLNTLNGLVSSFRCSGCVGLDLARVAQGKLDACIHTGENLSIPMATELLVTEAGGFTTPISRGREIFIAGCPQIYKALRTHVPDANDIPVLSRLTDQGTTASDQS